MKKRKSKEKSNSDSKGPVILGVDNTLDKYLNSVFVKEKTDRMNEILRRAKLPDFDK